ncbi:MAG TPA: MBL fold metallo-hydrolase [Chloroflexi bacterium]|nr:MBL fold metallo-hydrolase [Chloroflexota bacterium]
MTFPLHLTYAGHATVLIGMDGVRLLADPVLLDSIGPLRRQMSAPNPAEWALDAVLISHAHQDHLHLPSLRLLGPEVHLIAPRGAGGLLQRQGFHHVEELRVGETAAVGDLWITATPAAHSNSRLPFGPTVECLGYVIGGSRQVYFAGDTDLFPEMIAIGRDLDVALLPVWGWGPRLGSGHMDPLRAAQSLTLLRPRVTIPIHWGTFCPVGTGWMEFLCRPPHAFAEYAAELAPQVEICILEPGQSCYPITAHPFSRPGEREPRRPAWMHLGRRAWQALKFYTAG